MNNYYLEVQSYMCKVETSSNNGRFSISSLNKSKNES
jgi:hypothetical protein